MLILKFLKTGFSSSSEEWCGAAAHVVCTHYLLLQQHPSCWFQLVTFSERFIRWCKDCFILQFSLLQDSVFSCSSPSASPSVTWLPSDSTIGRLLCVPARLSPLCPPWPGTAYRTPRRPHSCSALFTGDHRLKPGRITDTRCLCVWCFAGTPSAQEMLSAFFPPSCSVVGHYNRIQLPSQSIPRWFQPLPAIGSHRQWGYAIISDWLEQQVSSCERAKLFMAEQRSSSFTIGNYHAHSPPSPPFNLWSVCRWVRLGAD